MTLINSEYKSVIQIIKTHILEEENLVVFDGDLNSDLIKLQKTHFYKDNKRTLVVSTYGLEGDAKIAFLNLIRDIHESGHLLFKERKAEDVFEYDKYFHENTNDKEVLAYYENIIPNEDLKALEMSMYMRKKSKAGKNIFGNKNDIRQRFGDIGAYISNLCSLDYFEGEIMEIHKNSPKKDFDRYYELAVTKKCRAMFIHTNMNVKEFESTIDKMIAKLKTYDLEKFSIHAKGGNNVSAIKIFYQNRTPKNDGYIMTENKDRTTLDAISYDVTLVV